MFYINYVINVFKVISYFASDFIGTFRFGSLFWTNKVYLIPEKNAKYIFYLAKYPIYRLNF